MKNTFSAALQSRVWAWGVGVKQTLYIQSECVFRCVVVFCVCVCGGWQHGARLTELSSLPPLGISLILTELPNPGSYRPLTHTLTDNLSWQFGSANPHTVRGGRDFTVDFVMNSDTATTQWSCFGPKKQTIRLLSHLNPLPRRLCFHQCPFVGQMDKEYLGGWYL